MGTMEIIMLVLGACLAVSEVIAQVPAVKANSVFQIIFSILKAVVKKKD